MRGAVRNKERWKGRRAPTQDPSTNHRVVGVGAHIPKVGCTLSGWASYAGYSGPALTARAKIDGVFAANATANIHRKIAGDHGFVLEFSAADCEKLQGGSHWVTVEALSGDGPSLSRLDLCGAHCEGHGSMPGHSIAVVRALKSSLLATAGGKGA